MKKIIIFFLIIALAILAGFILSQLYPARAESDREIFQRLLTEIEAEKNMLNARREELDLLQRNLRAYERELDDKRGEFQVRENELVAREEALQKKIEDKVLDRQMIETFESIDAEQAAILMANLFQQDSHLAIMVMRRLAGKKSGKILEAMIEFDPEGSTALARETLDYFRK